MDISKKVSLLYGKGIISEYEILQELEELSENNNTLYPYLNEFIAMLNSEQCIIRVRGFRLLCKQAKWDSANIINKNIDGILAALSDEKPTAIRQVLQYLKYIVLYKKELNNRIKEAVLSIDYSRFKGTMCPLIEKDSQSLVQLIEKQ